MQLAVSHTPPEAASAVEVDAQAANQHISDKVPVEIMLELAISVITSQRDLLVSRDREIDTLHRLLKFAISMFVPSDVVWQ